MPIQEFLHCPSCTRARPVETPPCADGHGDQCPERVCLACGAALLVAAPAIATGTPRVRITRLAA